MTDSVSISTGIAGRYATALFELSREADSTARLENDVSALRAALGESDDLRALITSPVYSREEMASAITAVAERMGLDRLVTNTLAVMASKRRLFALPLLLDRVDALLAEHNGIVSVEVLSAEDIGQEEMAALESMLKDSLNKAIRVDVKVDSSLIGGLSVKIGSRLVDASIRTRLAKLKNVMQEVG